MKTITSISLLTLLTFTASIYAFAADDNNYNEKYAVTTNIQIQSERGKGAHFRSKYNDLLTMIKAKQLDADWKNISCRTLHRRAVSEKSPVLAVAIPV